MLSIWGGCLSHPSTRIEDIVLESGRSNNLQIDYKPSSLSFSASAVTKSFSCSRGLLSAAVTSSSRCLFRSLGICIPKSTEVFVPEEVYSVGVKLGYWTLERCGWAFLLACSSFAKHWLFFTDDTANLDNYVSGPVWSDVTSCIILER